MKIRVAFVDSDSDFLDGIKPKIRRDYSDRIEASYFSGMDKFLDNCAPGSVNVAVISAELSEDSRIAMLPCPALFLSEDNSEGTIGKHPVMGKYKKLEDIYRGIFSLYVDTDTQAGGFTAAGDSNTRVITFCSPAGGTGNSTMAISCAEHLANAGKQVMYLNLEKLPFHYYSNQNKGFEELMFALKDKHVNLSLKIESLLQRSNSDVLYISGMKNPLDMLQVTGAEMNDIVSACMKLSSVDFLVIDIDFAFDESLYDILKKSNRVIVTTDGSKIANSKTTDALKCVIVDTGHGELASKLGIIYNKFTTGEFSSFLELEYENLGSVRRYKAPLEALVNEIKDNPIFAGFERI